MFKLQRKAPKFSYTIYPYTSFEAATFFEHNDKSIICQTKSKRDVVVRMSCDSVFLDNDFNIL